MAPIQRSSPWRAAAVTDTICINIEGKSQVTNLPHDKGLHLLSPTTRAYHQAKEETERTQDKNAMLSDSGVRAATLKRDREEVSDALPRLFLIFPGNCCMTKAWRVQRARTSWRPITNCTSPAPRRCTMRESGCACKALPLSTSSVHPTSSSGWKRHEAPGFSWAQTHHCTAQRHRTTPRLVSPFWVRGDGMVRVLQGQGGWLSVKNQAPKL